MAGPTMPTSNVKQEAPTLPDRTVQDIINAMTSDQLNLMALIIGAAVEDVNLSNETDVVAQYNALSAENKNVIDFVVGGIFARGAESYLNHSDDPVQNFLAHYGVKGMRWGFQKSDSGAGDNRLSKSDANTKEGRRAARAAVNDGRASLGEAHLAALKSTGHRVFNAFMGDKTYWQKTAALAGIAAAGITVSLAVPAVMPSAALAAIGSHIAATTGTTTVAIAGGGTATLTSPSAAAVGAAALTKLGVTATVVGANVKNTADQISNLARAVRGNARINNSYASLGKQLHARQVDGSKRVQDVLRKNGSIKRKNLSHEEELVSNFLAHHGVKGMRWGIRRKRTSDGTVTGTGDKKKDDENSDGEHGGGSDSSSGGKQHLSADAERALKTANKPFHELSDREIKEANARAQAIKQYNELFHPPDPNKDLAEKVARLNLEKQYGQLQAELHPSTLARVARLAKAAAPMFGTYQQFASSGPGKALTKMITDELKAATATSAKAKESTTTAPPKAGPRKSPFTIKRNAGARKANRDGGVHNVTNVGRSDPAPGNPFIPALEQRR